MAFETIPEMRKRHKREILAALHEANSWFIPQSRAAERHGMALTAFNNLLRRNGIDWDHPTIRRTSAKATEAE